MILLFNVPALQGSLQVGYIVAIVTLYMFVFASFSVPYLAIASALSSIPHQRTVLMAWRLVFTAIGILIAGGLAPAFVAQLGGGERAYSLMALLLAAFCFVSLMIAFFGARKAIKANPETTKVVAGIAQSETAINGVKAAFALVPAMLYILGALLYSKWGYDTVQSE